MGEKHHDGRYPSSPITLGHKIINAVQSRRIALNRLIPRDTAEPLDNGKFAPQAQTLATTRSRGEVDLQQRRLQLSRGTP
jgi:hypothetical protein